MTGCRWCGVGPEDECTPDCDGPAEPWLVDDDGDVWERAVSLAEAGDLFV